MALSDEEKYAIVKLYEVGSDQRIFAKKSLSRKVQCRKSCGNMQNIKCLCDLKVLEDLLLPLPKFQRV